MSNNLPQLLDDVILVEAPKAREFFEAWVERGDAVGVFQNSAMDSASFGHVIYLPILSEAYRKGKIHVGKTHAPDGSYGPGWKYLLRVIVRDLSRFKFID